MKNRMFILMMLIVLLISFSACKATETETAVTEAVVNETEQQDSSQNASADQAYPVEEILVEPAAQAESAYPINQDDLGQLAKAWLLTASYIDGLVQETAEKTLELKSDYTYQIITTDDTSVGTWTARQLATGSNLVFNSSEGTMFSYQITVLEADTLVLTSTQDGKSIEEHFTSANW
jgi:hypothetical protein